MNMFGTRRASDLTPAVDAENLSRILRENKLDPIKVFTLNGGENLAKLATPGNSAISRMTVAEKAEWSFAVGGPLRQVFSEIAAEKGMTLAEYVPIFAEESRGFGHDVFAKG